MKARVVFLVMFTTVMMGGLFFQDLIAEAFPALSQSNQIANTTPATAAATAAVNNEPMFGFETTVQAPQDDDKPVEFKEVAAGDKFHINVLKQARKQVREGKLSRRDFRKLRIGMLSPAVRKQAKEFAEMHMKADNPDQIPRIGENIDWDALLAFIEKLIPLILEIIDIISAITDSDETEWQIREKIESIKDRTRMLHEHTDRFRQVLAA